MKAKTLLALKNRVSALELATLLLSGLLLSLSISFELYNHFVTHYSGNDYFPPGARQIGLLLLLMLIGTRIMFDKPAYLSQFLFELLLFYLVMILIATATNAVQLTPFQLIDPWLVKIDLYLHVDTTKILAWLANYPWIRSILTTSYGSLTLQMMYIPFALVLFLQVQRLREYYFLLIFGVLIGFTFYYFWPSIAPSSFFESEYFAQPQRDTGLKFFQIHYLMKPTTLDGGLIAMPSFHVMWAWLCLYAVRGFKLIWWPLLYINVLLVIACVVLGWHYLVDVVASVLIMGLAHALLNRLR